MAKRRREPDTDCTTTEMGEFNTVFVDTSLGTHLAMLVSSSDTVSDFKKKMVLEHEQCFPTIGEIQIHSVKVERRSNFYHLPDIMRLWSVFHGEVIRNWFLSADVSGAQTCLSIKNTSELDISNGVKMGVTNIDDNCRGLSLDVDRMQALQIPLSCGATEKNVVSEMIAGLRFEKSVEKTTDFHSSICLVEKRLGTDSHPKKKRNMRITKDECQNPRSEDACALFRESGKDTSKPLIVSSGNLMADAIGESPGGGILLELNGKSLFDATAVVSVVRNDHFERTPPPTTAEKSNLGSAMTSQNLLASAEKKEDKVLDCKMDDELAQDAPIKHSECVSVVPVHSARLMDAGGGVREVNTDGSKKKKKKVLRRARKLQDPKDMDQTRMGETMKPCSETHKFERKEEEKGLSLEHDRGVKIMPSNSKASDHVDPELMPKKSSFSWGADAVRKPEISSGIKKKKKKKMRQKKSVDINIENPGIEQTDNCFGGSSGALLPSTEHIPGETCNGEGIMHHEGKDVQMLLDSSTIDALEIVQGVDRNEANSVILTQTEQASEDVSSGKNKAEKRTQSSGIFHADNPPVETENPIMEFNQVDKGNKNTGNKDIKASKKSKKRKLTTSEVYENLPVEDQHFGVEALATKETSVSLVNSKQEGRHVDSSLVLYSKTEEKSNEMHGIAGNTDDLKKTSEKERKGIIFKQYFVPSQDQDKVDSCDKVKKATKSKMKTSKRVEDTGLPSVSNSTELQDSIKSLEYNKAENKYRRKDSSSSKGCSAQNSDRDDMISNSLGRSSGASEKGVKDSDPRCEATLQKPNLSLTASSLLNKKNQALDKSSSERSEILPRKQGDKRLQSVPNVTNMIPMKTPQKKSLFTKSEAIFQDNSGESSGDENGTMHSDGSTVQPSDSSSVSGDSFWESDLSQDSTRNGSNDGEGRFTGQGNISKLDLSASKELTMDVILRSSKRFKKAKLLASQNEDEQNESQAIEFVPDSQPS